jgi:pimeloyl-ACP methyl ester carboxylesterase
MHVDEFGPTEGVPIVFLHGSMVAGWMWMGQVGDLPDYRCLIPDFPGFHRSAEEEWISFADTADRVAEMIKHRCVDETAHIVGLSLGGIIGLNLTVRHPGTVRSLIISGVPYGTVPPLLKALSRAMLWLYNRAWGARFVAHIFGIPADESMDTFLDTARRTDPSALRAVMDEVNRAPLPQGLNEVTTRVLAVAGEKDTAPARRAVSYLHEVIPGATGCTVPEAGHQWNAEKQELFSEMVRSWIESGSVDSRLLPVSGTR